MKHKYISAWPKSLWCIFAFGWVRWPDVNVKEKDIILFFVFFFLSEGLYTYAQFTFGFVAFWLFFICWAEMDDGFVERSQVALLCKGCNKSKIKMFR